MGAEVPAAKARSGCARCDGVLLGHWARRRCWKLWLPEEPMYEISQPVNLSTAFAFCAWMLPGGLLWHFISGGCSRLGFQPFVLLGVGLLPRLYLVSHTHAAEAPARRSE